MKICLLFALYLFGLALYPCSDDNTCKDEINTGNLVSTNNHEHHDSKVDLCTPFCACACCHTRAQQTAFIEFPVIKGQSIKTVSSYLINTFKTIPHTVWQPPKIS